MWEREAWARDKGRHKGQRLGRKREEREEGGVFQEKPSAPLTHCLCGKAKGDGPKA